MRPRDYQRNAIERAVQALGESKSALLVCATGGGKTVICSHIVKHFLDTDPRRIMWLAHREELIFQAHRSLKSVTGHTPDVEMAERWADTSTLRENARIVVSSVQTQLGSRGGRMERFRPSEFSLLVVDEAHHAAANGYRKVIDYYTKHSRCKLLGCTATPNRSDEAALGEVFEVAPEINCDIVDLIEQGWLVNVDQQFIHVHNLDFSQIRSVAGDLNQGQLEQAMIAEQPMHEMVDPTIRIANGRPTLVFCVTVAHAERVCEIFNRHIDGCARIITGATDKNDRRQLLKDYKAGQFQFLVNVGVATEGWDEPSVQVVAMMRPTKSEPLYRQMVGRGTRPLPGVVDGLETAEERRAAIIGSAKPSMLVLDFVGNSGKHKLISCADVLGGRELDEVVERARRIVEESNEPRDMSEAIEEARNLVNEEIAERARKNRQLIASASWSAEKVDPFGVLDLRPVRERGWDKMRPPTEKQKAVLAKAGVNYEGMNNTEIKRAVQAVFDRIKNGLATTKQVGLLRRYGIDAKHMPIDQARKEIDAIAQNGWRRAG